jgi:hypothetical protein
MQLLFILLSFSCADTIHTTQLTIDECRQRIITHKTDESVNYKAGSTASGDKVAPADLLSNRDFGLGKDVVIPLDIPLKDYAQGYTTTPNDAVNATVKDSKIYTGVVDMTDGQVRINGESTEDDQEKSLRDQCKKLYPNLK